MDDCLKCVTRKLCAIIPKDHSLAPVSQGTGEGDMDTIVQVKFFWGGEFQFHAFKTIRFSLRGN